MSHTLSCFFLIQRFSQAGSTLTGFLRLYRPLFFFQLTSPFLFFHFYGTELRKQVTMSFTDSQFLSMDVFLPHRLASLVAVYIIGGFLYQRLVVGAKGMEQFPHLAFWQDLGNLVAVSNRAAGRQSRWPTIRPGLPRPRVSWDTGLLGAKTTPTSSKPRQLVAPIQGNKQHSTLMSDLPDWKNGTVA